MKIKVGNYSVLNQGNECYLKIDIAIEFPDGQQTTFAKINVTDIGYFIGKVPMASTAFLYLSAIVYAIDRFVLREKNSIEGWSREFDVDFKLPEADMFSSCKNQIERLLSFLTGDYWNCSFYGCNTIDLPDFEENHYYDQVTQVNLFSGGMDSLIGAIDYMALHSDGHVFLASHYDKTMKGPKTDQRHLLQHFNMQYPERYLSFLHGPVLIEPEVAVDATCRSRSLMFIAIALQVAIYRNCGVVIPENGSVSLNYPLSPSRRTSCSTRTTHPIVLHRLRTLFESLGIMVSVINPYEFMTKGEMVQQCADRGFLLQVLSDSNSCGKRGRKQFFFDNSDATHCGRCMPCMYRRAALVGFPDHSTYGFTLEHLFALSKKQISDDFYAMLHFLKQDLSDEAISAELRIAGMGQMPRFGDYVELVKKTRDELKTLIVEDGTPAILHYINL